MTKSYFHYSDNNQLDLHFRAQIEAIRYFKPTGLWLSDENEYGWSNWCGDENFHLGEHKYEVYLNPVANLRVLDTVEKIDEFHKEFAKDITTKFIADRFHYVDWFDVARAYDGVIISPYQWERRYEYMWYYGWDCASGCIWNPKDAVSKIVLRSDVNA